MNKTTILVTGASGQIGSVLVENLRLKYGRDQVIATDIRPNKNSTEGIFEILDALDILRLKSLVQKHKVTQIYHLVAVLSANGEANPLRTWDINMQSWLNVLETAKDLNLDKVFFPSSIAVFGDNVPADLAPQSIELKPNTVYGLSKVSGENWALYYSQKYGIDVRSIRYPGLISYQSLPGGGTTDYAIDIFHHALKSNSYTCFLKADTKLPMLYMDDAIRATLELMDAPKSNLGKGLAYNLGGLSFSPKELGDAISKMMPGFKLTYDPDFRQKIADSWPNHVDDNRAQNDWNWKPNFDLHRMTSEMLNQLKKKFSQDSYQTS